MDDDILRMYIDEVFAAYDYDRSGLLEIKELHTFLNQLYISMNDPRRFTEADILQYVSSVDYSKNGRISKPQLFILFKKIWEGGQNQQNNYNQYGGQGQYGGQQGPYNQPFQPPPQNFGNGQNIPNSYQYPGQGQYGQPQPPPNYNPYQNNPYRQQ